MFFENELCGQQTNHSFDTIKFIRNRHIEIGDYYSNTKINCNSLHANLFKVSGQFHYFAKRNTNDGTLTSGVGLGADLSNDAYWLLNENISGEEKTLSCRVEMYCRGIKSQNTDTYIADKGYYNGDVSSDPILLWKNGANGYVRIQDKFSGQFRLTMALKERIDLDKWLKELYPDVETAERRFLRSNRDFVVHCNFQNNPTVIVYVSRENLIYLFHGDTLLGIYHPEKRKFLAPKSKSENPLLMVKEGISDDERINMLFLSMFSQWFINGIHTY